MDLRKAFHRKLPGHPVEEQRALTLADVPLEHDRWTHAEGSQTIHTLTRAFRLRRGKHKLFLGMDLRVLADTLDDIRAAVKALHAASVTIIDKSHPDETDIIDMLARAQKSMRWNGDRRHQRRKGAKGGTAKGVAMEAKRNAILARDIVVRMKAHPKLTTKDCADILGPPFSIQTLNRNY
jgi:hypothetical protein